MYSVHWGKFSRYSWLLAIYAQCGNAAVIRQAEGSSLMAEQHSVEWSYPILPNLLDSENFKIEVKYKLTRKAIYS